MPEQWINQTKIAVARPPTQQVSVCREMTVENLQLINVHSLDQCTIIEVSASVKRDIDKQCLAAVERLSV